jgi:hypothetical protein
MAFVYRSSRSTADLTFQFLVGQEPLHQSTRQTDSGKETVVVYCFFGYHDTVCEAAGKELRRQGYTEITRPIDSSSSNFRDRRMTSIFMKRGRAGAMIRIGTGRFLEERPDGGLSFSGELDWVNVVIQQTRSPFSLRRELRSWWDKIFGKKPPPRTTPALPPGPG